MNSQLSEMPWEFQQYLKRKIINSTLTKAEKGEKEKIIKELDLQLPMPPVGNEVTGDEGLEKEPEEK